MTRLFNDPTSFADEMIDGFVAANSLQVRRVSGGAVREPLADETAEGGIVPRAPADDDGDVLHFTQAQEKLRGEGVDCRTVVVTDDIASASPAEKTKRRGIAGDLTVFKAAAAASEAGYSIDDVERVAILANERTRSLGVAFTGCTLPGADTPLFTVPEGRMAVGMGIHGEPGLRETDVPSADGLAELLVGELLAELPDGVDDASGQRAGVILNGLGSVKYEELFVVYKRVAALLDDAGVTVIDPEVGELVTSFDMAGVSLTLFWLDDELETFWRAPADTPAYRKGSVAASQQMDASELHDSVEVAVAITPGGAESQRAAAVALTAVEAVLAVIEENADELGRIDAVAGDGDHGVGMQRGARAAAAAAREAQSAGAGVETLLVSAADAWADRAGGTSGALWGVMLRALAAEVGDTDAPTAESVSAGVTAARVAIQQFGKAELGDKTMVDAIVPFAEALARGVGSGASLSVAWSAAADVATEAARATAELLPRIGRARPHAEKSLGTPDAGAHSFALIVHAVAAVLAAEQGENA
jgi:dihydroxyacetone kinase